MCTCKLRIAVFSVCHCYVCVTRVYTILTRKTGSQVVSQADFITAFVSYRIPLSYILYSTVYIYLCLSTVYCRVNFCILYFR
jgi:hypothetical protein